MVISNNIAYFAMCKAMSPSLNIKNNKKFKTKIMSKTKTNNVFSTATIYDKYNAEAAQKRTGYMFEWSFDKEKTLKVSSFLQKLNDDYGVPRKAFYSTLVMNSSVLDKYFLIPEDCRLSIDAIRRMAVCIILMMPPLNKNDEFIESCKKAGINSKGVILDLRDDELEDLRSEFCDAFGSFGCLLIHSIKSVEVVLAFNEFYYDKFSTKNKKNNDTQHN